jgi:hypothetical protein
MSANIPTVGPNIARRAHPSSGLNTNNLYGVYVAEVVSDEDSQRNGRVTIRISDLDTDQADRIALLSTSFGGNTDIPSSVDDETSYEGSPKTYGMWPQPPAPGTNVLVAFSPSIEQGIIIGAMPPRDRNATMGGNASGDVYDPDTGETTLAPSAEKNPNDTNDAITRPMNPEAQAHLLESGLAGDFVRGHSMSSARRESPSNVFGMTTKAGHTISMDDGAEGGNSNNIRIKTRGGSTILMDDTSGFIFITNKGGSAYVEIDAAGRVDIFSEAGMSVATNGDYNVHAKGSINMQAEQGFNIKSSGGSGVKIESSVGSIDLYSAIDVNTTADANMNLKATGNYILKAARVDINGPAPKTAEKAVVQSQTVNNSVLTSIAGRVPEHHPWLGMSSIQESFTTGEGNTG